HRLPPDADRAGPAGRNGLGQPEELMTTPKPQAQPIRPLTRQKTDACRICCRIFPKKPDLPLRPENRGISGPGKAGGHRPSPDVRENAFTQSLRKSEKALTATRRGATARDGLRASTRPAQPGVASCRPPRARRGRQRARSEERRVGKE